MAAQSYVLVLGDSNAKGYRQKTAFSGGGLPSFPELISSALGTGSATISCCGATIRPSPATSLLSKAQYLKHKQAVTKPPGAAHHESWPPTLAQPVHTGVGRGRRMGGGVAPVRQPTGRPKSWVPWFILRSTPISQWQAAHRRRRILLS